MVDQSEKWLEIWAESDEERDAREKRYFEALRDKKRAKTRGKDTDAGGAILLRPQEHLVCICGHTLDVHDTLGNNGAYAKCRIRTTTPCHCDMHAQPIIKITTQVRKFQRQSRGIDRPHAFTGAIQAAGLSGDQIEWLKTTCDRCGNEVPKDSNGQPSPRVFVLDEFGEIQRPGREQPVGSILSSRDTGKHIMLCTVCDYEGQFLTEYEGPDDTYRGKHG